MREKRKVFNVEFFVLFQFWSFVYFYKDIWHIHSDLLGNMLTRTFLSCLAETLFVDEPPQTVTRKK